MILSGFDFGLRQNGQRVMNVEVPLWAKGSTRLFTLIHRQVRPSCFIAAFNNLLLLMIKYRKQNIKNLSALLLVFYRNLLAVLGNFLC